MMLSLKHLFLWQKSNKILPHNYRNKNIHIYSFNIIYKNYLLRKSINKRLLEYLNSCCREKKIALLSYSVVLNAPETALKLIHRIKNNLGVCPIIVT
jgi:hypothetical protein